MSTIYTSTCIRCGKERIILKAWSETRETRAGDATVSFTTMVCPDSDCQKEVDKAFLIEKTKREQSVRMKLHESLARKRAISRARTK